MGRKGIIAIYARVSTSNQTADSQWRSFVCTVSVTAGRTLKKFTDCISGGSTSRTGLDRLMGLVRRGKVATIVAFKLDRLACSLVHLMQLISEPQSHHTALVVPPQGIDTTDSNPVAQLQLNTRTTSADVGSLLHEPVKILLPFLDRQDGRASV